MNYILQFIIGGFLIVGFSYIASKLGPKAAALFYALPIQFTIHIVLLYMQNKDKSEIFTVSKSSILSLIIIIIFLSIYAFCLIKFSFINATIIAYIIFMFLILFYIFIFF